MTLRIDIKEWQVMTVRHGKENTVTNRRFTLIDGDNVVTFTEDEARRVWEAFAPYFDGREVSEG